MWYMRMCISVWWDRERFKKQNIKDFFLVITWYWTLLKTGNLLWQGKTSSVKSPNVFQKGDNLMRRLWT